MKDKRIVEKHSRYKWNLDFTTSFFMPMNQSRNLIYNTIRSRRVYVNLGNIYVMEEFFGVGFM